MLQTPALSVVVSSFNTENKVVETLRSLYENRIAEDLTVEVIVVDDGSPLNVEPEVKRLPGKPANVDLKVVRQDNKGIGATRNRGFTLAKSDRVLFLDDDIILPSGSLAKILAYEAESGKSVFFGSYPFRSYESAVLEDFADTLYGYSEIGEGNEPEKVEAITSGLLFVNKDAIGIRGGFYKDTLSTPASEEYEVISRLARMGVEIWHVRHISAIHNHHLTVDWLASQQFKYGVGTAEAFAKFPEIKGLGKFGALFKTLAKLEAMGFRPMLRRLASGSLFRKQVVLLSKIVQHTGPRPFALRLFALVTTLSYWSGYLEGKKRFGSSVSSK